MYFYNGRMSSHAEIYSLVFIKINLISISDGQYNNKTADWILEEWRVRN